MTAWKQKKNDPLPYCIPEQKLNNLMFCSCILFWVREKHSTHSQNSSMCETNCSKFFSFFFTCCVKCNSQMNGDVSLKQHKSAVYCIYKQSVRKYYSNHILTAKFQNVKKYMYVELNVSVLHLNIIFFPVFFCSFHFAGKKNCCKQPQKWKRRREKLCHATENREKKDEKYMEINAQAFVLDARITCDNKDFSQLGMVRIEKKQYRN